MPELIVIPTVDVEGVHGDRPFEQLVLGRVGVAEPWGIGKIAQLLRRHSASGTFFMDVYEHTFWGRDVWQDACTYLLKNGQDVQLHTHPGWRDDVRDREWLREVKRTRSYVSAEKDFMTKLNLAEQIEVLEHGCDLLQQWSGERPIAHRSGGYSVNATTIAALREVGIKLDSSQNRGHVHSHLTWSWNRPVLQNGILEVPITLYDRVFPLIGTRFRRSYRRMKTSVRFSTTDELVGFGKYALNSGLPVLNLFMHSYSLLQWDKEFRHIAPAPAIASRLESILQWAVKTPGVEIMSLKQYFESGVWKRHITDDSYDAIPSFSNGWQLINDLLAKIRYKME